MQNLLDPEAYGFASQDVDRRRKLSNQQALNAILQGVGDLPYTLLGAPVDISTGLLRVAGMAQGEQVGGGDWIKRQATDLGIRPADSADPTMRDLRMASEIVSGGIDPTRVARVGGAVAGLIAKEAKPVIGDALEAYMAKSGLAPRVVPDSGLLGATPAAKSPSVNQLPEAKPASLLDYRGEHSAPGPDYGAPLHDLTGGGQMYPADVYSPNASQLYGGGVPYDQKAFSIAQSYKDSPNKDITIYRAVPKQVSNSEKLADIEKKMAGYMKRGTLPKEAENFSNGSKWYDWAYDEREKLRNLPDDPVEKLNINAGDWVTLTKDYAKDHGESALKGDYKIISKKVKAKDLWTNADSIHEFGYHPSK